MDALTFQRHLAWIWWRALYICDSCLFLDTDAIVVHTATVTALRDVKIYKFWWLVELQLAVMTSKRLTNNREHIPFVMHRLCVVAGIFTVLLCENVGVDAHIQSDAERRCARSFNFAQTTCKRHAVSGIIDDECACLLDRIKCYPKIECDYADFERESDLKCQFPIFQTIFNDNCAHYSDNVPLDNTLQIALAWVFAVFVLIAFVGYFAVSTQYRNPRQWAQDGCITVTALGFTIIVTFVWIGGMTSLLFVFLYIAAGLFIFFGCINGVNMQQGRTVDGSDFHDENSSGKHDGKYPAIPTADVVYQTGNVASAPPAMA